MSIQLDQIVCMIEAVRPVVRLDGFFCKSQRDVEEIEQLFSFDRNYPAGESTGVNLFSIPTAGAPEVGENAAAVAVTNWFGQQWFMTFKSSVQDKEETRHFSGKADLGFFQ